MLVVETTSLSVVLVEDVKVMMMNEVWCQVVKFMKLCDNRWIPTLMD